MTNKRRFSRRGFLARTSSAVATAWSVPWVLPGSAIGAGARPAPSERINVGMIGMGRQTRHANLKQFLRMEDVQVTAVCDVDAWRLDQSRQAVEKGYAEQSVSGTYSGCAAVPDYRDILKRDDIDAVMVATPDHWHIPMALEAFEAGKDVSLEKPIQRTIAEGRQLSDASKRLGRVFRVDSELRSHEGVHRAAELVRNGRIGEITRVTVGVPGSDVGCPPQPEMPMPGELDYERWQGPAPRAPYTRKGVHPPKSYGRPGWMRHLYYCDGMITNWGTHLDDAAMWCCDLERTGPVEIAATGTYPPPESFWNVLLKFEVNYRFANGLTWKYHTGRQYFTIEGTEGKVTAGFGLFECEPASLATATIGPDETHFRLKTDKRDFIDCVKSREETLQPAEVGHRVTSLCLLGHIGVQVGKRLAWDPEAERFTNSDEANAYLDKPIHEPVYHNV